jgi:hypothetical protein
LPLSSSAVDVHRMGQHPPPRAALLLPASAGTARPPMARGLAREQSKAKNLKKSAGGKKQDDSGLTPQQRNGRCARKWLTGSSTGCCIRVAPAAWSSLLSCP